MNDTLIPASPLLLDLIAQARPGITPVEALANGAHYRARLGMTDGWTAGQHRAWCRQHAGRALIVLLDDNGRPHRPTAIAMIATHHDADTYLAAHPNAVVVARFGVWSA